MNDTSRSNENSPRSPVDLNSLLEADFAPDWAKQTPGSRYGAAPAAKPAARKTNGRAPQRSRPPAATGARHPPARRSPHPSAPRHPTGPTAHERTLQSHVQVSLLPNQLFLKAVVRKIRTTRRSFALSEISSLFMAKEESCDLKIELGDSVSEFSLFQCARCGMTVSDAALAEQHVMEAHLDEHFERTQEEAPAPVGTFSCVARCRLSGVVLGPPNHHAYARNLHYVHQTRYPHLSLEAYSRHIETVRDPDLIDQWKQQQQSVERFRLRQEPRPDSTQSLDRSEAETWMQQHVIPAAVRSTRRAILPKALAHSMPDRALQQIVRYACRDEKQCALSLKFALRGAFRGNSLMLWKTVRGSAFVSAIRPDPLPLEHVVESIRTLILHVDQHPGCTPQDVLRALHPDVDLQAESVQKTLSSLSWLIEKGHVMQCSNQALHLPRPYAADARSPRKRAPDRRPPE